MRIDTGSYCAAAEHTTFNSMSIFCIISDTITYSAYAPSCDLHVTNVALQPVLKDKSHVHLSTFQRHATYATVR